MKTNTRDDDYSVDIVEIITILIKSKKTILIGTIIGFLFSFSFFYDYEKDYENTYSLGFKVKNIFVNTNNNILLDDISNNLLFFLSDQTNIYESLYGAKKNIEVPDDKYIYSLSNYIYDNNIEVDALTYDNISPKQLKIIISFKMSKQLDEYLDVNSFFKNLITKSEGKSFISIQNKIQGLIDLENEKIRLLQDNFEIDQKKIILMLDKEIKLAQSSILYEKIKRDDVLNLNLAINDNEKKLIISKIKQNITLAKPFQLENEEFDLINDIIREKASVPEEYSLSYNNDTIFALSLKSGIPLYMFGSKILNSELNALESGKSNATEIFMIEKDQIVNKYEEVSNANLHKVKIDDLRIQSDYSKLLLDFEVNFVLDNIASLKEKLDLLNVVTVSNNLFDQDDLINIQSEKSYIKSNSNFIFSIFITTFIFLIITIFIVLYRNANRSRTIN